MNYTSIVSMIMRKEPLQAVLDAMAEHLQAAIIFVNEAIDILAFSKIIPPRDPDWIQALHDGCCSGEMFERIYNSHRINLKRRPRSAGVNGEISYSPDDVTLKYCLELPCSPPLCSISVLALPLEDRFEKHKQDILLSFANLVKNTYLYTDESPVAYSYRGAKGILLRLLNHQEYEELPEVEATETAANDASLFEHIHVLVFSPEFKEIVDVLLYAIADHISDSIGNDYATVYNNSVVTIFQPQAMTEACTRQLITLAKRSNGKIGISWEFSGKEQVYRHYMQATYAIEMAKKLRMSDYITRYDDMYIYALVEQCRKREYWVNIEHPVLTKLRDYDTEHASYLYDTLYCLLKSGINVPLAAKKLKIHKSTLYHRIEVLKKLIPDFMDKSAEWQASLMLAFDLAQFK